jgi:hypothetical protein
MCIYTGNDGAIKTEWNSEVWLKVEKFDLVRVFNLQMVGENSEPIIILGLSQNNYLGSSIPNWKLGFLNSRDL